MKKAVCVLCGYAFYSLLLFLIPVLTVCIDCPDNSTNITIEENITINESIQEDNLFKITKDSNDIPGVIK